MPKQTGTFSFDTIEKVLDVGSDFLGFGSVMVCPDSTCQISLNDNTNYISYDPLDKVVIGGYPIPVQKLYVKSTGTGTLKFWCYK